MGKIEMIDVGRVRGADYIDLELIQKKCDSGFRLVTVIGDIERKVKFGNPMYGIFEELDKAAKPEPVKAPEPKKLATETNDSGIEKEYPEPPKGKRMSFADKVRAEKAGK